MMRVSIMIVQSVILMLALSEAGAFLAPTPQTIRSTKLHAIEENEGMMEGLVAAGSSLQSQLASAFSNLEESDQYDAVLTGLCAKILDEPSLSGDDITVMLDDPISLLEEMNARRVKAGSRSLMALVDAAAASKDSKTMAKVISLSAKNGSVSQYGLLQRDITQLPTMTNSKVPCPDGVTRTRGERLANLPDIPTDERGSEISSALAVSGVLGFCWVAGILDLEPISTATNFIWVLIVAIGALDNFYDLLKFGTNTFAKDKVELPQELPLGLGSGALTGTVVQGFNRLITVDTERECECEAAAFFVAYTLGLPCFSFKPNALEAAVMVAESSQPDNQIDPLLTNNGMMKMLVWLMAPVAMESEKHPQLIQSDPREAGGFMERLEKSSLVNNEDLWWLDVGAEQEKEDMLKWAYAEADLLLRRQSTVVTEITERLASGAATVGDCVAAIENY
mmetsp:Transcript_16541/g.34115  ORF Transcript_16541/g.34115 Transcript_16541/m.34115 type:complete len:451 (+) Transcript_16541:128-1480(+)